MNASNVTYQFEYSHVDCVVQVCIYRLFTFDFLFDCAEVKFASVLNIGLCSDQFCILIFLQEILFIIMSQRYKEDRLIFVFISEFTNSFCIYLSRLTKFFINNNLYYFYNLYCCVVALFIKFIEQPAEYHQYIGIQVPGAIVEGCPANANGKECRGYSNLFLFSKQFSF